MSSSEPDLYELLGISKDATPEEIRQAYREAARRLHPDVNVELGQTSMFLQVQEAYEVLSDPKKRAEYDENVVDDESSTDMVQPIATDIFYSRSKIPSIEESQLIYALLDFMATDDQKGAQPRSGVNFCLVLDRSTSMQGERMETVKAAAIELVRQLEPEDRLSIVVFSDRAEVLLSAELRPDQKAIEAQIRRIQPGGGTEIFQGLNEGFSEIRRNAGRAFVNHIILLTDGRTYGDEEDCLELADAAAKQGVRITGLGIGTEWNDVFVDELAARTGGNSIYVSRSSDIQHFLEEKYSDLSKIYAEQVTLHLEPKSGVTLGYAFRKQPDAAVLPTESPLRLGWIPKEDSLSILLEIIVPPIQANSGQIELASGELNLVLPSRPASTFSVPVKLERPIGDPPEAEMPPTKIFHALSQITLYRMQDRARQEVSEGKIQKASLRLQRLATQLLSLGHRDLAHTALMEAERIQQTHMFSEAGEKQIKYGTRSLLLPSRAGGEAP